MEPAWRREHGHARPHCDWAGQGPIPAPPHSYWRQGRRAAPSAAGDRASSRRFSGGTRLRSRRRGPRRLPAGLHRQARPRRARQAHLGTPAARPGDPSLAWPGSPPRCPTREPGRGEAPADRGQGARSPRRPNRDAPAKRLRHAPPTGRCGRSRGRGAAYLRPEGPRLAPFACLQEGAARGGIPLQGLCRATDPTLIGPAPGHGGLGRAAVRRAGAGAGSRGTGHAKGATSEAHRATAAIRRHGPPCAASGGVRPRRRRPRQRRPWAPRRRIHVHAVVRRGVRSGF